MFQNKILLEFRYFSIFIELCYKSRYTFRICFKGESQVEIEIEDGNWDNGFGGNSI